MSEIEHQRSLRHCTKWMCQKGPMPVSSMRFVAGKTWYRARMMFHASNRVVTLVSILESLTNPIS